MKRIILCLLLISALCADVCALTPQGEDALPLCAEAAVLMEKSSGEVIYEKNPHQRLPPASVTKVMTMLLVVEAMESGTLSPEDIVTGSARAKSMGGSEIWLEEGEQMSVAEMLKCVAVVSANDCAVALAEHISGSEESFVIKMNQRAQELGCTDTNFRNCTGLFDDDEHYTSAADLALMSRELISHDSIKQYTTIWMDTIRDGAFGLSNTNKLIRYYPGATGLKTGYTSKAGHCLAATAEKNGVEYIAVVLKDVSSSERFEDAKKLLNFGFANYAPVSLRPEDAIPPIPVILGTAEAVQPICQGPDSLLLEKARTGNVQYSIELPEQLQAPVRQGELLGKLRVFAENETLAELELVAADSVERMGPAQVFAQLFRCLTGRQA